MPDYELYTDGSSFPNKKQGGWAFHLKMRACSITQNGATKHRSNNTQELLAVIHGLEAIEGDRAIVTVYTDSEYVIHCQGRIKSKYKWQTPLLLRLRELCELHHVTFVQLKHNRPKEHLIVHHLSREAAWNGLPVHRERTG